jgi:WD40 repeat protein
MGTPGYISPEQIERGAEAVDVRSDVYALGALLYEMLTDAPVVDPESMKGKSLPVALLEIARREPPRPSLIQKDLRGDLDAITLKAMALEPERRYSSASALAEEVGRFLNHQPVTARAPGTVYLMRKFAQRHRFGVAAALGLFLTLLAATIVSWLNYRRAENALELAAQREESERAGFSRQDYIAGRQAAERGRHGEAIAHLCRSLRTNPSNEITAVYLHELLQRTHIGRTLGGSLHPPESHRDICFLGVNSRLRQIVAICRPTADDAAERPDMLVRWDTEKGTRSDATLPTGVRVTAFQLSADEEIIAMGLSDGSLARFDFATTRHMQFAMPMNGAVTALAFTQDAQAVLAGTEKGAVQLWDLETHVPLAAAMDLGGPVHLLACDGQANLAVAASDADLACCAPRRGQILGQPQRMPGRIGVLVMAAERPWAAAGMRNGVAWIVDVPTLRLHGTALPHSGPVTAASFSADGRVLLTGDAQGLVWSWQLPNARPLAATQSMDGPVMLCRPLSQRGHSLAVSQRGELRLWQALSRNSSSHRSKAAKLAATAHDGTLTALAFAEEPEVLVWETRSRMLEPRFFSMQPPEAQKAASHAHCASRTTQPGAIFSLESGGKRIATNGDRRVRITKAGDDRLLVPELVHEEAVTHLLLSPDARTLITITIEGVHHAWDAATGDALMPPWKHGEKARAVRMSADGRVYHYERPGGGWFTLPLPLRNRPVADWFLDFAEKYGGRRLKPDGTSQVTRREFTAISGRDGSANLARWLLTLSHQRTLWPGDEQSFESYLDALIRSGLSEAAREARRFEAGLGME